MLSFIELQKGNVGNYQASTNTKDGSKGRGCIFNSVRDTNSFIDGYTDRYTNNKNKHIPNYFWYISNNNKNLLNNYICTVIWRVFTNNRTNDHNLMHISLGVFNPEFKDQNPENTKYTASTLSRADNNVRAPSADMLSTLFNTNVSTAVDLSMTQSLLRDTTKNMCTPAAANVPKNKNK